MKKRKMSGKIELHRNATDCGKNCPMIITINGTTGEPITGEVANGCTEVFDVEDGKYQVFVELDKHSVYVKPGVRSPAQTITVRSTPSTTKTLYASVIPKTGKIEIDRIDLQ
jgi:hypothetical protein